MLKQIRGIPLIFKSRSSTRMLNVLEVSGSMTIYCVRDFDQIFVKVIRNSDSFNRSISWISHRIAIYTLFDETTERKNVLILPRRSLFPVQNGSIRCDYSQRDALLFFDDSNNKTNIRHRQRFFLFLRYSSILFHGRSRVARIASFFPRRWFQRIAFVFFFFFFFFRKGRII